MKLVQGIQPSTYNLLRLRDQARIRYQRASARRIILFTNVQLALARAMQAPAGRTVQ